MNQPRKNLANSVLARAEAYRRGTLFEGVPQFAPDVQMPAAPVAGPGVPAPPSGAPPTAGAAGIPAAVPGAADALTAGAVMGNSPLETMLQP